MTQDTEAVVKASYGTYWRAWLTLLVITVAMIWIANPLVLVCGIAAKATIICLWFMHLKHERFDFVVSFFLCVFATALILYFLIAIDGRAM